ncbi:MAG: hypothetical protein QOK00_889 [Thermoleophilaceae bacterium]|nr:hypothetical protein [Thermoleophilaceae bacterium]
MPEIVQEIGAYAGLASVVGLAVLSALYFSQSRDVKRLREWAGRAPERSEQAAPAVPGRVVAQPQQAGASSTPAPPPVPGGPAVPVKPAVAGAVGAAGAAARPAAATPAGQATPAVAASATGAGAATAQQGKPAATPAGQSANAGSAPSAPSTAPSDAPAQGRPDTPAEGAPAAPAQTGPGTPGQGGPATPGEGPPATPANTGAGAPAQTGPDAPARPGTSASDVPAQGRPAAPAQAKPSTASPPRQAATPAGSRAGAPPSLPTTGGRFAGRPVTSRHAPQETAILPPRPGESWYSRLGARYLAVALVGLLVLGGAAAYGVSQLSGDDGGTTPGQSASGGDQASNGSGQPKHNRGAVKPGNVTVAVLNGTTVPGLAATLSDEVAAAGFKVGTITNFTDQQLAESVVQYAPGHEAEAKAVSRRLGIGQREPVDPSIQTLAGDASVIVIAGADKAP